MISPETIKEFQKAVKEEYGVELETAEATKILSDWVTYFDLLGKIDNRKETQTS